MIRFLPKVQYIDEYAQNLVAIVMVLFWLGSFEER